MNYNSKSSYAPDFLSDSERLHVTLSSAGIGIWEVRIDTNTVSWDDQCKRLFGLEKENKLPYTEAIKHIHSDDVNGVNKAVQDALSGLNNGSYDIIYRTIGGDDKKLRWVRFTGQAFFDEHGVPLRFAGIGQDITNFKHTEIAKDKLELSDKKFRNLANSLQDLIWTTDRLGMQTFASNRWKEFTGLDPSDATTYEKVVHPDDLANSLKTWSECLITGQPYRIEIRLKKHDGLYYWFEVKGDSVKDEYGDIEKWVGTFTNINEKKNTEQQLFDAFEELEDNEATFNDVTNSSPTGLWLSDELGELTYLNRTLVEWTGFPYDKLLGNGWANAIIDEDRAKSGEVFFNAVSTLTHYDTTFRIKKANDEVVWVRAAGDPYYRDGVYKGYAGFCMDIHEMVNFTNEIQAAEERFRTIVEQAPMAIGLLKGRDMVIEVGNEKIFEVWGKDESITGKRLMDALPEIKGQAFIDLLHDVYDTGKPFFGNGYLARLERNGKLEDVYFDFAYTPLRNTSKEVVGVMVLATEVTQQILAKKSVEEAESLLRGAIEMAELATWRLDIDKLTFSCSDRFSNWLGKEEEIISLNELLLRFEGNSRERFVNFISEMKSERITSFFQDEFEITNFKDGRKKIIYAHGQIAGHSNTSFIIRGTAQDVTKQRAMQTELEQLVQMRTEELAASNEELASSNEELQSTNEELSVTNEELSESTHSLERSNEELSQYAYIASHDLQEPLRKIMTFADRLLSKAALLPEHRDWTEKIDSSAKRMTLLIKNLLEFSRLIKPDESFERVDLNKVIEDICKDFELVIEESKAVIEIDSLPVLQASDLQMHQLFQNLISNALKFMTNAKNPKITITSAVLDMEAVQKFIPSPRACAYYNHFTVADNGIGFEQEYADQIFEIFKRLHVRADYKGSGIGLALCKRIVTNHSGYIYAQSELGKGSTFHIFIPSSYSSLNN